MTLSTKIVKKIAFYSAILGAGLGITALIPPLMPVISLFILPFLSGIIVLLTAAKLNPETLKTLETKDYAILGGISGTICCTAFLTIFTPMALLIKLIVKTYYTYGIDYLNFFLAAVLIFSIMLILFTINAAGGLLVGFLINWFRKN